MPSSSSTSHTPTSPPSSWPLPLAILASVGSSRTSAGPTRTCTTCCVGQPSSGTSPPKRATTPPSRRFSPPAPTKYDRTSTGRPRCDHTDVEQRLVGTGCSVNRSDNSGQTDYAREASLSQRALAQYTHFFVGILSRSRSLRDECRGTICEALRNRPATNIGSLLLPDRFKDYIRLRGDSIVGEQ